MLIRLLPILCLIGLSLQAAAEPINLYGAIVPISSQTARERNRAAGEGLKQVLVRVSGYRDVVSSPSIQPEYSKAGGYLEQYSYQIDTLANGDRQEQMLMVFSSSQVRRILAEAAQPVWPANRPKVLLWLVSDQAGAGKQFVSTFDSPVTVGLQQAARARGLPLAFPLMDLEDQLAITTEQAWSLDEQSIQEASERYGVDTLLVGRYTQSSQGKWLGTWQYFHLGQSRVYDLRADQGETLGSDALNPLADYLADRYAVTANTGGGAQFYVKINQIDDFKAYRSALNYLNGLAVIGNYRMISISDKSMLMGVHLAGDVKQLNNALSLDGKIRPDTSYVSTTSAWSAVPEGTMEQPLTFSWIGG